MSVETRFEGTCDVCGAAIAFDYDPQRDGGIDWKVTEDGRMATWVRHYATAPAGADPDCALVSSVVVAVEPGQGGATE